MMLVVGQSQEALSWNWNLALLSNGLDIFLLLLSIVKACLSNVCHQDLVISTYLVGVKRSCSLLKYVVILKKKNPMARLEREKFVVIPYEQRCLLWNSLKFVGSQIGLSFKVDLLYFVQLAWMYVCNRRSKSFSYSFFFSSSFSVYWCTSRLSILGS